MDRWKVSFTRALVAGLTFVAVSAFSAAPAPAAELRDLDFQIPSLWDELGKPWQYQAYVSDSGGPTNPGITLGSPGSLPPGYTQAARFDPPGIKGRPRSMAKLSKNSTINTGVTLSEPLDAVEGLERSYLWYVYFPEDFNIPEDTLYSQPSVVTAWHNESSRSPCNPNQQVHVRRVAPGPDGMHLMLLVQGGYHSSTPPTDFTAEGTNGGAGGEEFITCYVETLRELDLGPVVPGQWTQLAMHVRWSSDPAAGLTEIWRDGALSSTAAGHENGGANLYRDSLGSERGYLEQGIYMPNDNRQSARDRVVWQAGMRIATSGDDIAAEQASWAEALGRTVDRPPTVLWATTGAATMVTRSSATVGATVAPADSDVTYHIEYGPTDAYGLSTPDVVLPAGSSATEVSAQLSDLVEGSVYHYRVVASDASRTVNGVDRTLTTLQPLSAAPGALVVQNGALGSGGFADLAAEDGVSVGVNSTATAVATWYGRFFLLPTSLTGLRVSYAGGNTRSCAQTIALWRWTDKTWETLDNRTVGPEGARAADLVPAGADAIYVNSKGELRVRVRCQTNTGQFTTAGDWLRIDYDG